VVVLVLTVRRLREVNEALGHDSGDALLVAAADAVRGFAEDGHGWAARLSGRQFAVVVPVPGRDPASSADQAALAQRLVAAVRGPWPVGGLHVHLDATLGTSWAQGPLSALDPALLAAEAAARNAKDRGLTVQTDTASVRVGDRDGLALAQQLWKAIENDELRLHVQPLMDAARREVVAVEALVRWQHPTRGLLPPAAFLPQAEQSSSIFPLTWWVLEASLDQCRLWRDAGRRMPVAVNLSARLLGDPHLPEQVRTRLAERGLAPGLLTLEVTESALVAQPQIATRNIAQLRADGVHVAIDDFGTGFTSLSMLADLQVDELKVDRAFVAAALTSPAAEAIVRSVVDLGHRLGLRVVGEGVEDQATSHLLEQLGYDRQQGYLFSRPLPPEELTALLDLPAPGRALVPPPRAATVCAPTTV
jgi:EAL domain-containing protein (putative c-di-GMP-specific phosphodiesterase class I)